MNPVLVVADDSTTRRATAAILRHGGFDVKLPRTQDQVKRWLRRQQYVAVVLDLQGEHGTSVVADVRTRTELPIVAIADHADEWETVALLDAGADDCLGRPFGVEEFLARLRAVLRRFTRATDDRPVTTPDFTIHIADRRWVLNNGVEVTLSPTEWKVVEVLVHHAGRLVTHADILRAVWGSGENGKSGDLRVHLTNIRRKVEPEPAHPRYFITASGLGLRFVPTPLGAQETAS